jgi:hypothetical protein
VTGLAEDSGSGSKVIPVVIAVFQAIIVIFQMAIWADLRDHEARLRTAESEIASAATARAQLWTRSEHYAYDSGVSAKLELIKDDLALIKANLGIRKGGVR